MKHCTCASFSSAGTSKPNLGLAASAHPNRPSTVTSKFRAYSGTDLGGGKEKKIGILLILSSGREAGWDLTYPPLCVDIAFIGGQLLRNGRRDIVGQWIGRRYGDCEGGSGHHGDEAEAVEEVCGKHVGLGDL